MHDLPESSDAIDIRFDVPFTQRLRFTQDVLGDDAGTLRALLESEHGPARVLFVVESSLLISESTLRTAAGDVDCVGVIGLDGGERIKASLDATAPVTRAILDHHLDRRSYVIAIGGGALLDAVGMATTLAHRGLRLIRLPTTTLAQCDSGVAVKNAINHFGKKNWLGTFAVPWAVINDRFLLKTLPDRDWRAGFSEAIKVALLKDAALFEHLATNAGAIAARDWAASDVALRRAALLHLHHITRGGDPFETLEARPLDFGHWSAHRLEAMTNFEIRHGEAVAIGLHLDAVYSSLALGLSPAVVDRVTRCLQDLGLPLSHPKLADADALLAGLEEFREHLGGRLTVTMLRDVGVPVDVNEIDLTMMRQAIGRVAE
jgi:3-dehydroquinate synthase